MRNYTARDMLDDAKQMAQKELELSDGRHMSPNIDRMIAIVQAEALLNIAEEVRYIGIEMGVHT